MWDGGGVWRMWDGGGVWRMWDGGGVWRMWDGSGVWRMWDGGGAWREMEGTCMWIQGAHGNSVGMKMAGCSSMTICHCPQQHWGNGNWSCTTYRTTYAISLAQSAIAEEGGDLLG